MLGGPEQVSFELQQALGFGFNVGRLGFSAEANYEAYVEKLLRAEREPAGPVRATYFTVRDGTAATELGHRMLMQPCIDDAEAQRAAGRFPASELAAIEEHDPVRAADRLLAAAAAVGPGVLFSCSHGVGAPRDGWRSPALRRALQGAPCLGGGQHLEAELLARAPFVPGGVWLMFACFGAGTPRLSAYQHWLRRLQEHGEHADDLAPVVASLPGEGEPPFLAKVAQAALANPAGPVAIISHLDLGVELRVLRPREDVARRAPPPVLRGGRPAGEGHARGVGAGQPRVRAQQGPGGRSRRRSTPRRVARRWPIIERG